MARYPNNNLTVLPGLEIGVEENSRMVHVLALFPEDTNPAVIERVLDDSGVEPSPQHRTGTSKVTRKRLVEIAGRIRKYGGMAVLCHVNSDNGYRREMRSLGRSDGEILRAIQDLRVISVGLGTRPNRFARNSRSILRSVP